MRYLGMVLMIVVFSGCGVNTSKSPSTTFAVVGDRTGLHVNDVNGIDIHKIVFQDADEMHPDLSIMVGDMIEGYTENELILDQQWDEYLGLLDSVRMPVFFTPGNHDLFMPGQMGPYLEYIGDPYYSFDYKNIHFVILDNSRWQAGDQLLDNDQYLWLKSDLSHNKQPITFVFCHIPYWNNTMVDNRPTDSLHTLFLKYQVSGVFAAHFHNYFKAEYDGISYVISGRAGGGSTKDKPTYIPKDSRFKALDYEPHRFLLVKVEGRDITIENYPLNIEEQHVVSGHNGS